MDIWTAIEKAYQTAKEKGFWEDRDRKVALLLIHCEISEAVEALRDDDKKQYHEELADIAIRLFDLMGYEEKQAKYAINFQEIIKSKMNKNDKREYKHGKKF